MTDRRAVWLAIATAPAGAGAGALIAGIVAHIPFVWIVGSSVLVASALGITSLLSGWPMASLARSDPPIPAVSSSQDDELPTFIIPTYASEEQEMWQLGALQLAPRYRPEGSGCDFEGDGGNPMRAWAKRAALAEELPGLPINGRPGSTARWVSRCLSSASSTLRQPGTLQPARRSASRRPHRCAAGRAPWRRRCRHSARTRGKSRATA